MVASIGTVTKTYVDIKHLLVLHFFSTSATSVLRYCKLKRCLPTKECVLMMRIPQRSRSQPGWLRAAACCSRTNPSSMSLAVLGAARLLRGPSIPCSCLPGSRGFVPVVAGLPGGPVGAVWAQLPQHGAAATAGAAVLDAGEVLLPAVEASGPEGVAGGPLGAVVLLLQKLGRLRLS